MEFIKMVTITLYARQQKNHKINLLTAKYTLYNLEYVNNASLCEYWGFPGDSAVKNLPEMQESQESQVRSMGWEDPLEKGMEPT